MVKEMSVSGDVENQKSSVATCLCVLPLELVFTWLAAVVVPCHSKPAKTIPKGCLLRLCISKGVTQLGHRIYITYAQNGWLHGTPESGSRFDPRPQRLTIFHLILGGRSESLLRKPGFPWKKGTESPENCSGSKFCPNQVLLSKNFHSRRGCRQKSLLRNSGVGGGDQNLILS